MKYGYIRDTRDSRDFLYRKLFNPSAKLPAYVDLSLACSPVENQGDIGSCTAHALAGALEFLELKDKAYFAAFSRLFIYYNERTIEGTINEDAGAQIRDGIKSLVLQGACPETLWPYDPVKLTVKPSGACYAEALKHLVVSYHSIKSLIEMRGCLAEGFPFAFGFTAYASFESDVVARSGVVNMPQQSEEVLGGHAVLAVGYDDKEQRFIVRNSWGPDWGMKGYFTIPFTYLTDRYLANDFWTIRQGESM